jgi:ferric-dicitrate binding protein FerR (iron transport regulator)
VLGILDEAGRGDFDGRLRKSPEHMNSYRKIAAIWNEGPSLEPRKRSADVLIQHTIGRRRCQCRAAAECNSAGSWALGGMMGTYSNFHYELTDGYEAETSENLQDTSTK